MDPTDKLARMIAHLVFIHNSTPHRSTGYSPCRLMYGREPCLPIDQLLSRAKKEWHSEFLISQAAPITKMNSLAEQKLRKRVAEDKQRYDRMVGPSRMEVRQHVLLRQTGFTERHKLADKFIRDPYVIVGVNVDGDVCHIRPVHGGDIKTVNRRLLTLDPRSADQHNYKD